MASTSFKYHDEEERIDDAHTYALIFDSIILYKDGETFEEGYERKRRELNKLLEAAPIVFRLRMDSLFEFEMRHIEHVNMTMDEINAKKYGCGEKETSTHDHTKNMYYFFIQCGRYTIFSAPKDEELGKKLKELIPLGFDVECDKIAKMHTRSEKHHPEFEYELEACALSDKDVLETAVDRTSRSTYANKGSVNVAEVIGKYMPKFKYHSESRSAYYEKCVIQFKTIVEDKYRLLEEASLDQKLYKTWCKTGNVPIQKLFRNVGHSYTEQISLPLVWQQRRP